MASPKKATPPRRPAAAGKEVVPDAPSTRAVSSGPVPLQVVSPAGPPDPEVTERAARRRFTAEYKLRMVRQADACAGSGELGALLRREGLYSSHLTTWRRQWEQGSLAALSPKRRGRPAAPSSPLAHRVAELERENVQLTHRLRQAETIISVQKKVSEILGIPLKPGDDAGSAC